MTLVSSGINAKARYRLLYRCWACDYHFSATAGTIFHDTHLNIRDWFLAIYLMGSIEQGARVAQLQKYFGISHETAVNMARRIRQAIKQDKNFVERCVRLPQRYPAGIDLAAPNRNRHPTLHAVVYKFATEEKTREHVAQTLWPNGPTCLLVARTVSRCQLRLTFFFRQPVSTFWFRSPVSYTDPQELDETALTVIVEDLGRHPDADEDAYEDEKG